MKILFVCWQNVGRSQIAAALYNQSTNSHDADSAGTGVDFPDETLSERKTRVGGTYTIEVMDSIGINLRDSVRTQLTKAMLDKYDKIISMAQKEYSPAWLQNHPNYLYWHINDPGGRDYGATLKAMKLIKEKIDKLILSKKL